MKCSDYDNDEGREAVHHYPIISVDREWAIIVMPDPYGKVLVHLPCGTAADDKGKCRVGALIPQEVKDLCLLEGSVQYWKRIEGLHGIGSTTEWYYFSGKKKVWPKT